MKLMKILRVVSIVEGISFLLLLGVAMPLKYQFGQPLAVKIAGSIHGALFVALAFLILLALNLVNLPFATAVKVGLSSILPAGTFFTDRLLKQHEHDLEAGKAE